MGAPETGQNNGWAGFADQVFLVGGSAILAIAVASVAAQFGL